MSSFYYYPPRPFVTLMIVPLVTIFACASPRGSDTTAAAPAPAATGRDTASVAIGDAKSIENLFAGRFPGVTVTQVAGGGLQILIRGGGNTLYGNIEPLYVVDDVPLAQVSRGIVFLNPYDIEKIEVLKNPEDIAVYGSPGANGVIRITTRRPGRR